MKRLWFVVCEVELQLGARHVLRQYEVCAMTSHQAQRIACEYVMEQEDFSSLDSHPDPVFVQTMQDGRFVLEVVAAPSLFDAKAMQEGRIPEIRHAA